MADDNTVIEGAVKFRDGKKWKARWCVLRRLSPVADCVQMQLWRDARARAGGAGCKAALALRHFLGAESGFTLDKQSNTLALLCRDHVAVLAFDSRERLLHWQVKLRAVLGSARRYVVVVGGDGTRLPAGPARLHLHAARLALSAGSPPRLLGVWELQHLRRYGVVDGRFCFEGGALCGRGEGLHVLVAERVHELARDVELAARGRLSPAPGAAPAPAPAPAPAGSPGSPRWELGLGDAASLRGAEGAEDAGCSLARCRSCMSKLGALSRSSTAPLTPGVAPFSLAWTMDASHRAPADEPVLGPYDNYDVPKFPSTEVGDELYDTPRRLRPAAVEDAPPAGMVVHEPCGCVLRVRRAPAGGAGGSVGARGSAESLAAGCPCRRVAAWAHSWLGLRAPPAPPPAALLYATVDVARKARRRPAAHAPPDYENLSFALSLEHYENALAPRPRAAEYLPMEPAGYARMAPLAGRCASQPALHACAAGDGRARSSSVDSARFLEDVEEFEGSVGSSLETLRAAGVGAGAAPPSGSAGAGVGAGVGGGARDSSSSNDSGVSSCELRRCELPDSTPAARRYYRSAHRTSAPTAPAPRRARSEPRPVDAEGARSSSSGTSDMSDYVETLSLCSSHSSGETPARAPACTLRPRSGNEYLLLAPPARPACRCAPPPGPGAGAGTSRAPRTLL